MTDWPILSLVTFLPLLGAAIILVIRGDDEVVVRNARSVALWTSGVTFVLSLFLIAGFDRSQPGFQFVERVDWMPSLGIQYHMGIDGISLWFVPLSALLTILWRSQFLVFGAKPGQGIHGRVPGHGQPHDRRLLRARHGPVLRVLRSDPDPDVLDHRHLGWAESDLRVLQVLFVHPGRFGSVPDRDLGDLFVDGHHRRRPVADRDHSGVAAILAVDRDVRVVRRQGADVAVPHLAARCPCRGANGRLCPFGGCAL